MLTNFRAQNQLNRSHTMVKAAARHRHILLARRQALQQELERNRSRLESYLSIDSQSHPEPQIPRPCPINSWSPLGTHLLSWQGECIQVYRLKGSYVSISTAMHVEWAIFIDENVLISAHVGQIHIWSVKGDRIASATLPEGYHAVEAHISKETKVVDILVKGEKMSKRLKISGDDWMTTSISDPYEADYHTNDGEFFVKRSNGLITLSNLADSFEVSGILSGDHVARCLAIDDAIFILAVGPCHVKLLYRSRTGNQAKELARLPVKGQIFSWSISACFLLCLMIDRITIIDLRTMRVVHELVHGLVLDSEAKILAPSSRPLALAIVSDGVEHYCHLFRLLYSVIEN